jgi:hypothetical protein
MCAFWERRERVKHRKGRKIYEAQSSDETIGDHGGRVDFGRLGAGAVRNRTTDPEQYQSCWTVPNMTDTATGLQITAAGGPGSFSTLYYPLPAPQVTPLNTADTQVKFTWTWDAGNAVGGVNVLFALDDNNGGVNYYDAIVPAYSLTPTPGTTYSVTLALQQPNQANIAAGFPIGGLNFQIDPANVSGDYTMTLDSIELIPEPATVTLVGVGASLLGLLGLRRRRTS